MGELQAIDVLLVEDSRSDAMLVRVALSDSTVFRLTHVERLGDALAILAEKQMSVVLLDLGLPDSQGLETLTKLHRHTPEVPVIVLTSSDDDGFFIGSAQEGAHEYLVKSQLQDGNLRRAIRYVVERSHAERALRESDQQLRAIVEATPHCIKVVDADGIVLKMNAAGLGVLEAHEPNQVIGKSVFSLIAPESLDKYRAYHKAVCQGQPGTLTFEVIGLQGNRRTLESVAVPLQLPNGPPLHLAISQDVTDRRELERQLRQSQKMEAVGQLAGGVAHDFNNLLTIMIGSCDILTSSETLTDCGQNMCRDISQAGQRAAALTRQLLAFSRRQLLEPVVLNLNEIVTNIYGMLARLIGEDIQLERSLAPDIWPVKLDPGQIEQVIVNLVVNARDAMPKGGQLTICTSNIEWTEDDCRLFTDRKPGRYVMTSVSDTGSGIPPEIRSRIFEPFFTTKEASKGTGLGLAVVYGIVNQSDGYLDVESEADVGTSIILYFPAVRERISSSSSDQEHLSASQGSETILLVEDEDGVRNLAQRVLERQGYSIVEARNGKEALDIVEHYGRPIHLVLTDVVMPVMNGQQMVESLRTNLPNVKVIYMSGYTDDTVFRHGINHDLQSFLQKPFLPAELAHKVRSVLDAKLR
jgi:PAS domain S-box-containing protein